MKTILATVAAALIISLPAFGIPFEGTFLQTVTFTSDPLVSVGETFTGTYHYDSPVIDGTFYAGQQSPFDQNPIVGGSFYLPGIGVQPFGVRFRADRVLTVRGGLVTYFAQHGQIGISDYSLRLSDFSVGRDTLLQRYSTGGTISFTNPTANVPEGSPNTAWLLAIGLFGLALVRPLLDTPARA